jgi:hypothetical protein
MDYSFTFLLICFMSLEFFTLHLCWWHELVTGTAIYTACLQSYSYTCICLCFTRFALNFYCCVFFMCSCIYILLSCCILIMIALELDISVLIVVVRKMNFFFLFARKYHLSTCIKFHNKTELFCYTWSYTLLDF